ncbi:beta-phosphoglucomutase [Pseudoneobacillus rhizosphaerae]|uniref:Beta-phosphoglucomutase n=1 Tax=Pseudoneobacillus rhizosphaerae TaxID=2880968 RepID=A0A9C7GC25_9BACI|nr:beta-phosphoglucomutase [Pseudoneobacillus rhizosphaerae]CAG9609709.1 Beta-phosphoglucomutase [Pseudoneobacillus rhizosphaerae]
MSKPLQAFIFDLDGVITDTAEYHYLAWRALGEELGIPFTREFNEELKGVSRMDSLEKILALGSRENDFSLIEKEALATKKNEHYVRLIANISPDDILPGIKDLITEIKEKGYRLGMASVSKNAFTVMDSLGLKGEFDIIVDAATIAKGKPDPEIFLTAAKLLNVDPSACIGIEDAAAGVDSIKDAGMFAVGVGSEESLAKADIIYSSTEQLSLANIMKAYQKK